MEKTRQGRDCTIYRVNYEVCILSNHKMKLIQNGILLWIKVYKWLPCMWRMRMWRQKESHFCRNNRFDWYIWTQIIYWTCLSYCPDEMLSGTTPLELFRLLRSFWMSLSIFKYKITNLLFPFPVVDDWVVYRCLHTFCPFEDIRYGGMITHTWCSNAHEKRNVVSIWNK